MFSRPTTLADAFINAAVKAEKKNQDLSKPKVDHWLARRVALNTERTGFAVVREFDRRPAAPVKKTLDQATISAINSAIEELVEIGMAEKYMPAAGIEA